MMKPRLFCTECVSLQRIKEYADERRTAILDCGHFRSTGLLPAKGISIESLSTPLGLHLFPVSYLAKKAMNDKHLLHH